MKLTKLLTAILVVTVSIWGIEALYFVFKNEIVPKRIRDKEERNRDVIVLEYKKALSELDAAYALKKYHASGSTVFERVFNTPDQSIVELITRIAQEALPEDWSCEVQAEEFTHFILMIYLPNNPEKPPVEQLLTCLQPITEYCKNYLSDVAVFDSTHKSYLFFDASMLDRIRDGKMLSKEKLRLAEERGTAFVRFNSVTIKCEKFESHLMLPVEVGGVLTCHALFDTGASTTMLSSEIISETGGEILQNAPRKDFSTVNGTISCPIVWRQVNIGGIRKEIAVAVNQRDTVNLVGMNFFEGMEHIVDFPNACIYVWEK